VLTLAAKVQVKRGKYYQACEFGREAVALDPKYWDSHFWLAIALNYSPARNLNVAELRRVVQKTLELGPDNYSSHQAAAKMYWDLQQRDLAEHHLQRAFALKDDDEWTLTHLGRKAHQEGRLSEARTYLEKLLQINPESADGNLEMGELLVLEKRPAEAVPFALAARRLKADETETTALFTKLIPFLHPWTHKLHNLARDAAIYFPPLLALLLIVYRQFATVPLTTLVCMWLVGTASVTWFCTALLTAVQQNLTALQEYQKKVSKREQIADLLSPLVPASYLLVGVWSLWTETFAILTLLGLCAGLLLLRRLRKD
jgi:tetratricopeptide (TPR) repeat protein